MVRLSIFEVTWKEMRVGKLALMVPVMTSTEGRCVARTTCNAGSPRHLRQPLHRAFDVLAGDHHQVGHLVDDHHDIRQRLEIELLLLVDRLAALAIVAGMYRARSFSPLPFASATRAL